jgi:hypothetical protein
VTVGLRSRGRRGGRDATRTRHVLDDERLAHLGGELLRHRPRDDVAESTGAEADQDLDRPRRIVLCNGKRVSKAQC